MTVTQSVADVLRKHVALEVEGIDRMYLNAVVPLLQSARGIAWFSESIEHTAFPRRP